MNMGHMLYELALDGGDVIIRHRRSSGCRCGTCMEFAVLLSSMEYSDSTKQWDTREIELTAQEGYEDLERALLTRTADEWKSFAETEHKRLLEAR